VLFKGADFLAYFHLNYWKSHPVIVTLGLVAQAPQAAEKVVCFVILSGAKNLSEL
jgi:hypothetical protein